MDYRNAFQISASGMRVEKARLEISASNLANLNTVSAPGTAAYQPLRLLSAAQPLDFSHAFGVAGGGARVLGVQAQAVAPRQAFEPGHPYADTRGFVSYPGVNHTEEMILLNTALRAYEANVAAMSAARAMAARTLDIGGQQ